MENITTICKLCYNYNENHINFKDEKAIEWKIIDIIKKHFWFKIFEVDIQSNAICSECWKITDNFNKFYNQIESAHNLHYLNIESLIMNKQHSDDCSTNVNKLLITKTIAKPNNNGDEEDMKSVRNDCVQLLESVVCIDDNFVQLKDEITVVVSNNVIESTCLERFETVVVAIPEAIITMNDDYHQEKTKAELSHDEKFNNGKTSIYRKKRQKINIAIQTRTNTKRKCKPSKEDNDDTVEDNVVAVHQKKQLQIDQENVQIRDFFNIQCELCHCRFSTFLEITEHYRTEHNSKGYITCCKKKFFRRSLILEHIRQHSDPEAFKCYICNKLYTDNSALKTHIRWHSSGDEIKPYQCDQCTKTFVKKFQLTHHKKYRHFTEADKTFQCDICNRRFLSRCYLMSHIKGVHENGNLQMCDICAKVFKSKPVLESHRQTHFVTEVKPKLQCNICGSWLKHKRSLRTHLARHKDTSKSCPQCGKETPNRDALRNHIKYVHATKLFPCNMCEKSFKKPIELKEHMASHTGEILYKCPHCIKTFNSNANLHSHRKKAHPIEWQENRGKPVII